MTVHVPLPERRPYRLVLRLDPLPFADGRPQRVRVFLDERQVAAFELVPSTDRMGSYAVDLSTDMVQPGRRLDLAQLPDVIRQVFVCP